ncbi:MAG TPA: hypothetical protein VKM93_05960 [Terriglobia bacterium]|nr:hypothetical protein [Terriglobia bacterium]
MLRKSQAVLAVLLTALLLIVAPASARAGDVDVMDATGFGGLVNNLNSGMNPPGSNWTGSVLSSVYLDKKGGVYTYVYQFTLDTNSVQLEFLAACTPESGGCVDEFNPGLNYGVLTGKAFTSPGVDDCTDTAGKNCPSGSNQGFNFGFSILPGNSELLVNVSGLGPTGANDPLLFTFYAQSSTPPVQPEFGDFEGKGGGTAISGTALVPTPTPEPASLSLLGTALGLLAVAGLCTRRRLGRG